MKREISRRQLLRFGALAGASGLAGARPGRAADDVTDEETSLPQVPRRTLGKTGETIPILLMGGAMHLDARFDPKLAECIRFGVNYFDAADCYSGGACEVAVGNFQTKADLRRDIWITSKSDAHDPGGFEKTVNTSLEKLQTDWVDMYFLHALQEADYLNDDMLARVERLKKQGKIKFFGFSCHDGNVDELLRKAAELGWIDAVMFRYNFRRYGDKQLNRAMDACVAANVGLIAMKTQGSEVSFEDGWKKFEQTGKWTKHQAVLKAVWEDERISAAVSHMDTFEKLRQNIGAALDRTELGALDREALEKYASATRSHACDGCDDLCGAALAGAVQVGAAMRCLMYHDVYGEREKAKELFRRIPTDGRRFAGLDLAAANRACPHGVDVAAHLRRASEVLDT